MMQNWAIIFISYELVNRYNPDLKLCVQTLGLKLRDIIKKSFDLFNINS